MNVPWETVGREEVMTRLLSCYAAAGPRRVVQARGHPVSVEVCDELLAELRGGGVSSIHSSFHSFIRPT